MKLKISVLLLIVLTLISCDNNTNPVEAKVDEFVRLYQERNDFEKFLELYDQNMVLEDMITGYRMVGIESFKEFFNWPDQRFKKLSSKTIIVNSSVIEGNKAVLTGHFTPFEWDGLRVEAMQFTTILEFNDEARIVHHVDWINYPNNLIDYSKRANANEWIED